MNAAIIATIVAVLAVMLAVIRRRRATREPKFAVGDWVYAIGPGSERGEFYQVTAVQPAVGDP
jgi:hypothetical protein